MHAKMMFAVTRPRSFDDTRPSSWISHMEYYVDGARVFREVARLRVAVSFLAFESMAWLPVKLGESQRPQSWTVMKEVIRSHSKRCPRVKGVR